jgi:type IV secretion system protein VirB9
MLLRILLGLVVLLSFFQAGAIKEPKSLAIDRRLGVIVYSPYDVHKFVGYYGYQSSIVFAEDETIDTISMGDSTPWQMFPNGNRLFLKPIDQDATTNMTLITNKRIYYFELHAKEAQDINQDGLMFAVRFLFPDDQDSNEKSSFVSANMVEPDLTNKALYNFEYTISGPDSVAPIKIFDDRRFTYFEFKDKNAELPAIFYSDKDGNEGLISYRMLGRYLVVESIRERFTIRYDQEVVCVFNEKLIELNNSGGAKKTTAKKANKKSKE